MSKGTIKLNQSLKVNGKDYKELNYNSDDLGVAHISAAETEKTKLLGKSAATNIKVAQADYLLHLMLGYQAIIICHPEIAVDDLKRIKGYDIQQIAMVGTSFFIPPAAQVQETSEKLQEPSQELSTVQ